MSGLCDKHADRDDEWRELEGKKNLPAGLTATQVKRQRAAIRATCERGNHCAPAASLRLV